MYDALTGFFTKDVLYKDLKNIFSYKKKLFAIIDIDYFKLINDTFGHEIGDLAIRNMASYLKNKFRKARFYRFGGDEFVMVADYEKALIEIVSNIAGKGIFVSDDPRVLLTLSVGVVIYPLHTDDVNQLFKYADTALLWSKRKGRARCEVYTQDMEQKRIKSMDRIVDRGMEIDKAKTFLWENNNREILILQGERGVGKTRLIQEISSLAKLKGFYTGVYTFVKDNTTLPFSYILSFLSRNGVDISLKELTSLVVDDPQLIKTLIVENIKKGIEELIFKNGVALFFDDFHFSSVSERELILYLLKAVDGRLKIILSIATEKKDLITYWLKKSSEIKKKYIDIHPLGKFDTFALIDAYTHKEIDKSTKKRIFEFSSGYPLYTLEILNNFNATGEIVFPSRREKIFEENLESISGGLKNFLKILSLLPSGLHIDMLKEMEEMKSSDVYWLMDRGIIEYREGVYRFTHWKYREVILRSIENRKELCENLASIIKRTKKEAFEDIAYLYELSGEKNKAFVFYKKALEKCRSNLLFEKGIDLINKLLKIKRSVTLEEERADFEYKLGQFKKALTHYNSLLVYFMKKGHLKKVVDILDRIADIMHNIGKIKVIHSIGKRMYNISEKIHYKEGFLKAYLTIGSFFDEMNFYNKALLFYEKALTLSRELKDRRREISSLINIGNVYDDMGNVPDALTMYLEAKKHLDGLNLPYKKLILLNNIGFIYLNEGLLNDAKSYFKKAREKAELLSLKSVLSSLYINIARVNIYQAIFAEAQDNLLRAGDIKRAIKNERGLSTVLFYLAQSYLYSGNFEKAEHYIKQCINIRKEIGYEGGLFNAYILYSLLFLYKRELPPEHITEHMVGYAKIKENKKDSTMFEYLMLIAYQKIIYFSKPVDIQLIKSIEDIISHLNHPLKAVRFKILRFMNNMFLNYKKKIFLKEERVFLENNNIRLYLIPLLYLEDKEKAKKLAKTYGIADPPEAFLIEQKQ